ncbi:uncharacterized protein LOC129615650 [Condylostylus longicornis]|uniref:uncharacterized protein LOC129615650 n=1 Tax=Condylostylus longicornis TaxID=2530218 RepID=UPI00244DF19A|nr:uncharacterized protein LOC129615650 [Condylostylus longicornis]
MSRAQIVSEIHRPARKNYRRRFLQKGLNDTWQIDLVEMIPYAKFNKGKKYMLTVIDTFSKHAFAEPVKNKTADNVLQAFKTIIKRSKTVPKNIHSDQGKEFFNIKFKNYMREKGINHYHTFSDLKASIVERFNRYNANWSTEIFKVIKVHNTYPVTYELRDYQSNDISGKFYEPELTPVKNSDAYLVEKILKKQGNKIFVKWLGFDSKHNSWINKKDLI